MNIKRFIQLIAVFLLAAGVVVACGEGEQGNQDNSETNQEEENVENAAECSSEDDCDDGFVCNDNSQCEEEDTGCESDEDCEGENEVCDPDANECVEESGCESDEDCEGALVCGDGGECVLEAVDAETCADDDPPRCSEDPSDFDFKPATHVDSLEIAEESESCCFDYTGDGDPNNRLPQLIDLFSDVESTNQDIAQNIDDGDLNIILEHDELAAFETGQEYTVNFLFADDVTDGESTINPASFEDGSHPHALVPNAVTDEGDGDNLALTAGPGNVILQVDLSAFSEDLSGTINLTVSNALIRGDLVDSEDDITQGVAIENGEIGGLIRFQDIVNAINEFSDSCECLSDVEELLTYNTDDGSASCNLSDTDARSAICSSAEDGCGSNEDCEETDEACDELTATCALECADSEDCTDSVCDDGTCAAECSSDDDCDGDDICNGDGLCRPNYGEDACGSLTGFCEEVGAATLFADIDTDNDGNNDAYSVGLQFEGVANIIGGISAE